jgi:uncharacterized damage-inducible protein DinB
MALGKLAMHIATLPSMGSKIVTTPSLNLADPSNQWPDMTFRSCDQMLATFDTGVLEVRTALAAASDSTLAERWKFSFGDRVISDESRSLTFRHMFVNHLIHHRAQLGVYLRLNDLPVPAVYGPSADEPF